MKKLNPILALTMASAATLFAQEAKVESTAEQADELPPVTVTATRVVMPTAELAQSYSLITSEKLEEARFQSVMEALRDDVGGGR